MKDEVRSHTASAERLRILRDQAPVGIREVDLEGHYVHVNDWYCSLTGYTRDELLGKPFTETVHPEDRDLAVNAFRRVVSGEASSYRVEIRIRHKDGHDVWTELNGFVARKADGRPQFGVGIVYDISERKRIENALRDADRNKNRFLALLAHELRGPLAPMRNAAQLLKAPGAVGERLEWVRRVMERQIEIIARMVDDLLDVSRITQGKISMRTARTDLATILNRAVEAVRPIIDSRGQQLSIELPSQAVHLEADSVRLEQVFGNLLNNASKFTDENGHIWLSATPPDLGPPRADAAERISMVEIRVRDDGHGIDADFLPQVFDAFLQADRTFDRTQGGLGIGLTLVRSIVELHGGTVEATSRGRGRGSEFVVRLPIVSLRQGAVATDSPEAHPSIARDLVSRRILVVDDHADARETLAVLLRSAGHEVQIASDGATAVKLAKTFHPQVVLLDIGLPGMDGFEVGRRLRELKAVGHMVLVAISGYGQEEDRRRARESGFDHYFTKPVGFQTVRDFIASPQTWSASDVRLSLGRRGESPTADL